MPYAYGTFVGTTGQYGTCASLTSGQDCTDIFMQYLTYAGIMLPIFHVCLSFQEIWVPFLEEEILQKPLLLLPHPMSGTPSMFLQRILIIMGAGGPRRATIPQKKPGLWIEEPVM